MASVDFVKVGALVKVKMDNKKTHLINAKRDDLDISYNEDTNDVTVTLKGLTRKLDSITGISVNGVAVTDEEDLLAKLATVFNEEGGGSGETPGLQAVSDVGDTTDHKLTMATLRTTEMPEYANNTAAISGGLDAGDHYSLPYNEELDVALVAIVRPAPEEPEPDPEVMKITVTDINEWIAATSVTDASSFKTFMQNGGANPSLVVSDYDVVGDEPAVITVKGSGLTEIPASRFVSSAAVIEFESETVTEIGESAWYTSLTIKKFSFPNLLSTNSISTLAFYGATALEEVVNSIESLTGTSIWSGCVGLNIVTMNACTSLPNSTFESAGNAETVWNFASLTSAGDNCFNSISGHTFNAPALTSVGNNALNGINISDALNLAALHVSATDFATYFNGLLAASFTIGVTAMDGEYDINDNDFGSAIKSNHITFAALTSLSDANDGSPFRNYGFGALIVSDPLKLTFPALTSITGSPLDGIGSGTSLTDLSNLTIEVPAALASHADVLAAQSKGATIISL